MRPSELEAILRERMEEPEATIHDMTDNGGYGLVRWSRPADFIPGGREHIVHRWANRDTAGGVIDPLMFYSGGYYDDEDGARLDYRRREDRSLAPI